nr:RNA-directed DNA polymerase [Jannaschia sp. S6380]
MRAATSLKGELVSALSGKDLNQLEPSASRRFIVPKDEISYRQATQLDPQDAIILSAIAHQFGAGIEQRRLPEDTVFSYRFQPTQEHGLYQSQSGWNDFWAKAKELSATSSVVLYCDIADFYNQIYHHVVENQLIASGFPNQATKWVIKLLESTTAGVSRGVPVGPHAIHLFAEASLIPVDNSLSAQGLSFLRYADDILVFCSSHSRARKALNLVAKVLDQQQRLTLQRHKTRFMAPADFATLSNSMVEDRPINRNERRLLSLIKRYSGGNPYKTISYNSVSPEDWSKLRKSDIAGIISEYLDTVPTDFIRLRWFYRRLAQIGHPGAIEVSIERISELTPCLAGICNYLASVQSVEQEDWVGIGRNLLGLVTDDEFRENEYFRLSLLSLFSRNPTLNHISDLIGLFQHADPFIRREIILAARNGGGVDWLRELKDSFAQMDIWQRRAFIYSCSELPADEKKYFLGRFPQERAFDKVLAKWAKS